MTGRSGSPTLMEFRKSDTKFRPPFLFSLLSFSSGRIYQFPFLILIMIDICQWRFTIGLWCSCQVQITKGTASSTGWTESLWSDLEDCKVGGNLAFSLVVFLFLLIMSGDIELNPGPKTGIHNNNLPKPSKILPLYFWLLFQTR